MRFINSKRNACSRRYTSRGQLLLEDVYGGCFGTIARGSGSPFASRGLGEWVFGTPSQSSPEHCGAKPGHFETSNHSLSHKRGIERSERAYE